jgi:uncharacterized phiE125 gp8 family phage protein
MAGLDRLIDEDSPAPDEPLTLAQAKSHLRVDFVDDDDLIEAEIAAARQQIEGFLKQSLILQTWRYRIDFCWPREIRLPVGPLRTTTGLSIQYVDADGATQTLATTEYQVSLGQTGIIRPAWSKSWPTLRPVMDAVTVEFKAGETRIEYIKPVFLAALKLQLGDLYANRESVVIGGTVGEITSLSARNLLTPFVRHD